MNKFFIFIAIVLFVSCNPEKRIQKNLDRFDRIGKKWLSLHPCANDSNTIYIPGKRDSVFFEVPVYVNDTTGLQKFVDSFYNELDKLDTACNQKCLQAYKSGYKKGRNDLANKLASIKVPVPVIDTLKITLKDKLELKILKADLDTARIQLGNLKTELEKRKGYSTKWLLLFIIACLLLLASIYFNIKRK